MNSRANNPDTPADICLRKCLGQTPPRSFIMKAGAGSGKTTSLVKGLSATIAIHGDKLRKSRQRIACITYTEIAASEIWKDIGNNPLIHVSTIHSFLWLLAKPFQKDIHFWVSEHIKEKIAELEYKQANYSSKTQQRTKDKEARELERMHRLSCLITEVKNFRYGTGSDYTAGILGHDDILKIVPYLIAEKPLFRKLLAHQFPFVFVDESQDTSPDVVEALKKVNLLSGVPFCLGFFGDPMQQIYSTGIGLIERHHSWEDIPKPENFRCSKSVLRLANAIRRDGDNLVQISGERLNSDGVATPTPEGAAHLFILPADSMRETSLSLVCEWMAARTKDSFWQHNDHSPEGVKFLVIVHQMAAKRLGFGDIYSALNSRAPSKFKDGFMDGSAWPVASCIRFLVPIAIARKNGQQLEVMRLIREYSPLLDKESLASADAAERLKVIGILVDIIASGIIEPSNTTVGELLIKIHTEKLLALDSRLIAYLDPSACVPDSETNANSDDGQEEDESNKEQQSMDAFLACPASQLLAYYKYISELSPFSTQQGIKGAEFNRVLVVLDDAESTHFQFSYEKYLGLKPLSEADKKNIKEGKETTVDRTRRLFYVSCTRALKDLAVVMFTENPERAETHIRTLNLFESDAIHDHTVLSQQ